MRRHPETTVTRSGRGRRAVGRRGRRRTAGAGAAGRRAYRRAGGGRGRDLGHAAAAAPDEATGHPARALRPARRADAHELRGARRRGDRRRLGDRADFTHGVAITSSFHLDDHTHLEPVRYGKGSNVMGLLQHGRSPTAAAPAPLALARERRPPPASTLRDLCDCGTGRSSTVIALVMQTRRQLDHRCHRKRGRHSARRLDLEAGPRRARTRPGSRPANDARTPDRRRDRAASPAAASARSFDMPDDRALPRRLRDRRRRRARRRRPVPPRLRAPGPARRRRLGGLREPRREPVADHHGAGRAGDVALAQQGRARPRPALGEPYVRLPPVRRTHRSSPTRRPVPCDFRSSA